MRPNHRIVLGLLESTPMMEPLPQPEHDTSTASQKQNDAPPLPVSSDVCQKCAEMCSLVSRALDNLPPGFNDICSDAPDFVHVADVGHYYRPWHLKPGASILTRLYQKVMGLIRPCPLCVMLLATRIWSTSDTDFGVGDELRLIRLNEQLIDHNHHEPELTTGFAALRADTSLYMAVTRKHVDTDDLTEVKRVSAKYLGRQEGFTCVRRQGNIARSIYHPRLVQPQFEPKLIRQWLAYCREHHQGPCLARADTVRGLHLIDCQAREIVEAPADAEYVALSYCWGSPKLGQGTWWWSWLSRVFKFSSEDYTDGRADNGVRGPLPLDVPAVISDAMEATLRLGFSYLWVDRYCIDQKTAAKHDQIDQMDSIYRGADFTIMAAAGADPSHGLAGVGGRTRRRQHACSVGDVDMIHTMPHPHENIEESAWFTRAWTFQEGVLSRRRLVFTDEQVYFECDAMNCWESLESNLDALHTDDKTRFRDCLRSGLFGHGSNFYSGFDDLSRDRETLENRLHNMIGLYTQRTLTYESDSLNAFAGVLRRFEGSPALISNIWGLPLRCTVDEDDDWPKAVNQTNDAFVASLAWEHEIVRLRGSRLQPPRRRKGFPSWSWCGWAGDVGYLQLPRRSLLHSIALEDDGGGALLSPIEYMAAHGAGFRRASVPPVLHIKGLVLPPSLIMPNYHKREGDSSAPTIKNMTISGIEAYPNISIWPGGERNYDGMLSGGTQRCVLLGDDDSSLAVLNFLILEPLGGGDWQRVGYVSLHMKQDWKPKDDGISFRDGPRRWSEGNSELRRASVKAFYKAWVDLEMNLSVELDEVDEHVAKLPTQSFRII